MIYTGVHHYFAPVYRLRDLPTHHLQAQILGTPSEPPFREEQYPDE